MEHGSTSGQTQDDAQDGECDHASVSQSHAPYSDQSDDWGHSDLAWLLDRSRVRGLANSAHVGDVIFCTPCGSDLGWLSTVEIKGYRIPRWVYDCAVCGEEKAGVFYMSAIALPSTPGLVDYSNQKREEKREAREFERFAQIAVDQ